MSKVYVLTDRPVREFISTGVVTVGVDDPIEDLVWKFQRYRCAGFPVVDERVVGIESMFVAGNAPKVYLFAYP